jgi:uncharacterized protein YihD (DUF1040 family)
MQTKEPGKAVYYSHPKWMYGTKDEEESIGMLKKSGILKKQLGNFTVLNPRDYDEDPDFARLKREKGISVCFKLIDKTECVVFQRFWLPERFKNMVLEYLQHADEYGSYRKDLEDHAKDVPERLLKMMNQKASLVTPGVAKEVNYALRKGMRVYELLPSGELKTRNRRLKSDFKGPYDPLYRTLAILLKAYRINKPTPYSLLYPPFWWLLK